MKRRTAIGGLMAGALPPLAAAKPGDIPMRVFGKTGVKLTVIGQAGGRFPLITEDEATAVTRRAVDLGINYFDTAAGYWNGRSEEIYGRVLPALRKKIFLTTKSTNRTRAGAMADLDASLKRLKTDYVDLWQVHAVDSAADAAAVFTPGGAIEASDVLSLPVHCTAIGCTTIGQLEDDARVAQAYRQLAPDQMAALQKRAERIKGPLLEDWKKNVEPKLAHRLRPEYAGG